MVAKFTNFAVLVRRNLIVYSASEAVGRRTRRNFAKFSLSDNFSRIRLKTPCNIITSDETMTSCGFFNVNFL